MPIASSITSVAGVMAGTAVSEAIYSPKAMAIFYYTVAKSCFEATGSKRVACVVAAGSCGLVLLPGPHQGPFIAACAAGLKGVNKLYIISNLFY
jgi:hypothetical protein